VQVGFRAKGVSREHRRRAGESTHRQDRLRRTGLEYFLRRPPRLPETPGERKIIVILQRDGGQCENLHVVRGFHSLLIHVLGRNEEGDFDATLLELPGDGESGKEMPARPAAGDGDERRWCVG
jgi:hypothetical protein